MISASLAFSSPSFIESLLLALICVLVVGFIKLWWGSTVLSKSKMETHRSDAYFRVFSFFLTQPKKGPARKRRFEYMEIGASSGENIEDGEGKDKTWKEEQSTYTTSLKLDDGGVYLACIDTSQTLKNDQTISLKCACNLHDSIANSPNVTSGKATVDRESADNVEIPPSIDNCRAIDTEFTDKDFDDDLMVCEPEFFSSSDESISPPEYDSGAGGPWYSNFDSPQFRPTLSRIEEADESWPRSSDSPTHHRAFRSQDLTWSMEALTSLSFKGSLSRVDTFDDLSTIQCEDGSDVDDDDDIEVEPQNVKNKDAEKLLQQKTSLEMTSPNHFLSDGDNVTSPTYKGIKAHVQKPIRPDSPPILVVDSLEDYIKSVEEQRQRPRKWSRVSNHSSTTESACSSRDSLNQLHLSSPDITENSFIDDVHLQYLPVSYAGVRVRRKNWVKRSVSNVHDRYYFSGDLFSRRGTLRQRIVRKLSKRYKSRDSLDGAAESTAKAVEEDSPRKTSRKGSIRDVVGRFMRHIYHREKRTKMMNPGIHESTWSLPANLENSYSSEDYYVTESEVLPE